MSQFFLIAPDNAIHELQPDKALRIGRSKLSQIVLEDGAVSRLHAVVIATPEGPLLRDNDSANGTLLNGRAVKEAVLRHGDTIQIGKFILYAFQGEREEAEQWVQRRSRKSANDQTITDFNIRRMLPADLVGDLSTIPLIHLLQTLVGQTQNGCLELSLKDRLLGRIYFYNSRIVNAETAEGLTGKEAFYQLAATPEGQFIFRPGVTPQTIAILENPSALLLEACRQLDEKQRKL